MDGSENLGKICKLGMMEDATRAFKETDSSIRDEIDHLEIIKSNLEAKNVK